MRPAWIAPGFQKSYGLTGPSPKSRSLRSMGPFRRCSLRLCPCRCRYGLSAPFRQGLSERGLAWAVGIPFKQKVYPADVSVVFPVANRGRPRKNAIPDITSISAQANRIKECRVDLFADRTSTATMRANQLRRWFTSMAYVGFD